MFNIGVSVIVPIYNVEHYLEKCVSSIINQTYKNIEIILVNDGSTDKSAQICKCFENIDQRVKVIHKENGGLSDARNAGLSIASGEYILFVDGDDFIIHEAIEALLKKAQEEHLDVLKAESFIEYSDGSVGIREGGKVLEGTTTTGAEFLYKAYVNKVYGAVVWKGLYKREFLIKNNLFFKKGIYHEDELWMPQVLLKAQRVAYIHFPFYHYVTRSDSITHMKDRSKHGEDLIGTALELSKIEGLSQNIRKIWKDLVIGVYYYGVNSGDWKKYSKKGLMSKKFALKYGFTRKNFVRTLTFVLNYRLYAFTSNLHKTLKKIRKH